MKDEEKARQETEAGTAGEETYALRRGAKEGVGSGEEITEEMIRAGLEVLSEYEWGWSNPRQYVIQIYRVMVLHQKRGRPKGSKNKPKT